MQYGSHSYGSVRWIYWKANQPVEATNATSVGSRVEAGVHRGARENRVTNSCKSIPLRTEQTKLYSTPLWLSHLLGHCLIPWKTFGVTLADSTRFAFAT